MIRVNVAIANISAERFWDIRKPIPPIQIGTNINIVGMDKKPDESLEVPFVLAINYNPSIAQISLKGTAYVSGDKDEIEKILKDHEEKKPPPPLIVQSISPHIENFKHSATDTLAANPPSKTRLKTKGKRLQRIALIAS